MSKARIKSIKSLYYPINSKTNEVEKTKILSESFDVFDEFGNISESKFSTNNSKEIWCNDVIVNTYDNGNLLEINKYDYLEKNLISKSKYFYQMNRLKERVEFYYPDNTCTKYVYEYDDLNKLYEVKFYNQENNDYEGKNLFYYDKDGHKIKELQYNKTTNVTGEILSYYNKEGNKIKELTFKNNELTDECIYDNNKNLIEEKAYTKKKDIIEINFNENFNMPITNWLNYFNVKNYNYRSFDKENNWLSRIIVSKNIFDEMKTDTGLDYEERIIEYY